MSRRNTRNPNQGKLFHMSHPAIDQARLQIQTSSARGIFKPVSEATFATLNEALDGLDNHYAENARVMLGRFESLFQATQEEDFSISRLDDDQLITLERHFTTAGSIVSNLEKAGALHTDAASEAAEAITRTTYHKSAVVKEAVKKEMADRETAQDEGHSR